MQKYVFYLVLFYSYIIQPSIILLQGTSSSGKSGIAKELKKLLYKKNPIILSIDDFLWKEASNKFYAQSCVKLNEEKEVIEQTIAHFKESLFVNPDQDFWFSVEQQLHQEIERKVKEGYLVIVDTTLGIMGSEDILDFQKTTKDCLVYTVIVYTSPINLLKNVLTRNAYNNAQDFRDIIDVISQFFEIYNPTNDTTSLNNISTEEIQICLQRLKAVPELQNYLDQNRIKELELKIDTWYKKNVNDYLKTIIPYDMILYNDRSYSLYEYAYQITESFQKIISNA